MLSKLSYLRFSLILFLSIIGSCYCYAQTFNFKTYSVEEGLPQSQVQTIFQDSKGYIWFGTIAGGISKFDGRDFENFGKKEGLCDNLILAIGEDEFGNIFVGTRSGLCIFNGKGFQEITKLEKLFPNYRVNSILKDRYNNIWIGTQKKGLIQLMLGGSNKETYLEDVNIQHWDNGKGLLNNSVEVLFEDHAGNIWVGTNNGLNRFTNVVGLNKSLEFDSYNSHNLNLGGNIRAITQSKDGNIWVGTTTGLSQLIIEDNRKTVKTSFRYDIETGLLSNNVSSLTTDKKGRVWIGTNEGASMYDPASFGEIEFINFTKKHGLSNKIIYSLFTDSEGNVWIGTDGGGVNKFDGLRFTYFSEQDGLNNPIIMSITEDNKGNLWFGSLGGGVFKLENKNIYENTFTSSVFKNYSDMDGMSNLVLTSIKDKQGNLLFVNGYGIGIYDPSAEQSGGNLFSVLIKESQINNLGVRSILEDSKGYLWLGTTGGGAIRIPKDGKMIDLDQMETFSIKHGFYNENVRNIFEDSKGNIWFATQNGLTKFTDGKIRSFTTEDGLSNNWVSSFAEGPNGNIWIGTFGGLSMYDGSNVNTVDEDLGLESQIIYSLIFDDQRNLWLGSNNGVYKLDVSGFSTVEFPNDQEIRRSQIPIKHFGKVDGFKGVECNQGAIYKDQAGCIWFGTIGGTVKYNPREDNTNYFEARTNIRNFKIFFNDTILKQNVELPYSSNYITFEYVGICFTNPEKVKYRYYLEGFDNTWSPETKLNSATYSNLPSGEYIFKVKSCNNEGVWNWQPTVFSFSITPPYWRTWWFYSLCVTSILVLIQIIYKTRVRKLKAEKEILEGKVEDRTKELQEKNLELEKLSIVARETDNSILITDSKGEIEWLNEGFIKNYEYSYEEYLALKGDSLLKISKNANIQEVFNKCINTKNSVSYETEHLLKSGIKRWFQTTLTPIIENNKVKKLIAIDSDITERKKTEAKIKERNRKLWNMSLSVHGEKEQVEKMKGLLEESNRHMTESISYASHIQRAMLTPMSEIKTMLPDSFVIYKPKDIVSGDFYWFADLTNKFSKDENNKSKKPNKKIMVAVCDCTGHGVPGAFMSMIGNDLLNQIVLEKKIFQPSEILKNLHKGITFALRQEMKSAESMDGMDAAICLIDLVDNELQYAGAHRPLFHCNGDLEVIKADKMGIGGHTELKRNFTNKTVKLSKGDCFYIFSDGYTDQFGGVKNKKFKTSRLKELIPQIHTLEIKEQEKILTEEIDNWKGLYPQTDDILMIGVKI
ncbi:MAG: SpoIIE family protein phosphatase [Bacteroidia bacterium]|nr:SpoIIE family protein phosphatase [Bacteroidia bacterium]